MAKWKTFEPVSYRDVRITDGFWKGWQEVAASDTVPAIYDQFEQTGRFSALTHQWREGEPNKPHIFYDSDAAKWIEGAAYSLFYKADAETEGRIEALIDLVGAGMSGEGYFNSYYQTVEPHARWRKRENHELYCAGHLIEAAVAYYEATGRRRFLGLMLRYAEYIRKVFVMDKSAAFETPGHEEIELALIRLWHCVGDRKWLELALTFIERRGRNPAEHCFAWFAPCYGQDQAPVAEQDVAEGHVVRFGYLFAAVADAARETEDGALLEACRRVWRDVVDKKLYVTGGVGNMRHGEAFGPAYFLPNFEAYTETCASIALAFLAKRLLTVDPRGEYSDIAELELYNGALAGISLDGRRFFYENPLSLRPSDQHFMNERRASRRPVQRVEVFSCSCCPPNILRMITAVGEWMYGVGNSTDSRTIYVHQYAQSEAVINFSPAADGGEPEAAAGRGTVVTLTQRTRYPWDGRISVTIGAAAVFAATIALRIPGWCDAPRLNCDPDSAGAALSAEHAYDLTSKHIKNGYVYITREWRDGDEIILDLPMEVVEIEANPLVAQDAGRVALRRGPLVYCVEGADFAGYARDGGERLEDLTVPACAAYETAWDAEILGGLNVIRFDAFRRKPFDGLYRKWAPEYEPIKATAIPYYAWGNRAEGEMTVWLRKATGQTIV